MAGKDFLQEVLSIPGLDVDRLVETCKAILGNYKESEYIKDRQATLTAPYSILLSDAPQGKRDEKGLVKYDELNSGGFLTVSIGQP